MIADRISAEFADGQLWMSVFVFLKFIFPRGLNLVFERCPAKPSPTFRKFRATQPGAPSAASEVQRGVTLWAGKVAEQRRCFWRAYAPFLVKVNDPLTLRISVAAQERSVTAFAK